MKRQDKQTNEAARTRTNHNRPLRLLSMAVAACLVLAIGLWGGRYYQYNYVADSIVDIDVNPSVELTTNRNNKVLEATAVNGDGSEVLDELDLKGTDLTVAVYAVIGAMVQNGYLTGDDNSILISVQNDDQERAQTVRNLVLTDVDASLESNAVTASVLNQTVTATSTDAQTFADENNISLGKAVLVLNLAAKDNTLDATELAAMTIRELADLVTERGLDISDIVDYDADDTIWENINDAVDEVNEAGTDLSDTTGLITTAEAKELALDHAGIAEADATFITAKLDYDNGVQVYDIEFYAGGIEYDYEINATTGVIISAEQDGKTQTTTTTTTTTDTTDTTTATTDTTTTTDTVTAAEAKDIALDHAGVAEADATFTKAELDYDDGVQVYDVEFYTTTTEYEYEINAATGAVVSHSQETISTGTTGTTGTTNTTSGDIITSAEAKQIALNHAGVSESNARQMEVELDYDDGIQVYEVEFKSGTMEYSYEIKAADGTILDYEKEVDD
ncbi:MAG: PepSY domain-containing protein [Clostridiales bacterium]|nr:PepSY domain-containing protein [Clostridiales bacterium]